MSAPEENPEATAPVAPKEEEEHAPSVAVPAKDAAAEAGKGKRAIADDDDDDHPERKRNRAAVRNYRARKKAYTASLEEEVKQLRLQNFLLMRNFKGNEVDANAAAMAANSLTSQPVIMIPGQQEKLAAQILALQQAQAPVPPPQPSLLGLALNMALAPLAKPGQQQLAAAPGYQPVQPLPVNMMNLMKEQAAADARPKGEQADQQALLRQLIESQSQQQQQPMGLLGLRQRLGVASPTPLPTLGQRLGMAVPGLVPSVGSDVNTLLQQLRGGRG